MKIRIITICFTLLLVAVISVKAQEAPPAPTVAFIGGDDILSNGGTDDPYDSLIVIDITASQDIPDDIELQYSTDGGEIWSDIDANFTVISVKRGVYFWSTSKIYAPTLLFRTRTAKSGIWSEYFQAALSLSHRVTNHTATYFVESFNDEIYKGSATSDTWDTVRALVELPLNPPKYHPNGNVFSTNLLSGVSNDDIIGVTFQPVQWPFGHTMKYQVSNNGSDWYGDTSGQPHNNIWFEFPGESVPDAVYVPFLGSIGNELYWKARLQTTNTNVTPQLYQMRFDWNENKVPLACFTVDPASSDVVDQVFSFNANCTSDFEEDISDLDFRWDWENDATFDTTWETDFRGYIKSHVYNSTSTFTINLEVRDSLGEIDSYTNSINEEGIEGAIAGWAWSSNYGWTSLNCDNTYFGAEESYCHLGNYGWQANADYTMDGWAWDSNLGWLCLGSTCIPYGNNPEGGTPQANYSRATGEVNGWGKYIVFGESGWLKLRDASWCDAPDDLCVHLDFSRHSLEGYAWAGGKTDFGIGVGPGWVTFQGSVNVPWLETRYSSIYGRGDLGSSNTVAAPDSRYNASYCILSSGDIFNLTSENNCLEGSYTDLEFPNVSGRYKTILGIIKFEDILDGNEVVYLDTDVDASLPDILDGKVYNFNNGDDYTIDSPVVFHNARNLNSSGAGTIVIEGNLHINSNIYYEENPVTSKIENLASVAWIVKGDVIVDPSVTEIVGNFIILGQDGLACPNDGCGSFKTGDDFSNPKQLVINGLIMAKQFYFQRYYKVEREPAEVLIYDGRVLINTPPGLESVAKGLPVWREAFATTEIE